MKIDELVLYPDYDHSGNHSSVWKKSYKFDPTDAKLIGKVKGYSILFRKRPFNSHIYVVDPKTNIVMLHVDGALKKNKAFHINTLSGRIGSPIKAAEFYRALIQNDFILVTGAQSVGGLKVWRKLASYPDVTVFGYYKGKTYNVDPHIDPEEETHVDLGDTDEFWDEFDDHDDVPYKEYQSRKKELQDLKNIEAMDFVAHKKIGKHK